MAKADDLIIYIRTDDGQLDKGINSAERKLNTFGNNLSSRLTGAIAGAFAIERIAAFTGELIKTAAEADGVQRAFERIDGKQYLQRWKEATHGTVTELELMKRGVQASNFDIPLKNLSELFAFATKRAQDTGESVDYLVNSIVFGIGRKSPLILDNLGISAVALKEKLHGVGLETASVGDIAEAVGQIARDSLAKTGDVIDNESIRIQQNTAKWNDLKLKWGELIQQSGLVSFALNKINDDLEIANSKLPWYEKFWYRITQQHAKGAEKARELNQEQEKITETTVAQIEKIDRHVTTVAELREQIKDLKTQMEGYGINQVGDIQRTLAQIKVKEELLKKLTTLNEAQKREAGPSPLLNGTRGTTAGLFTPDTELETKKLREFADGYLDAYNTEMARIQEEIMRLNEEVNYTIVDSIAGGLEAAFAGQGLEGVLNGFLTPIASFLSKEGKLLIVHGLALEAFKKSLQSLNGVAAIAVGGLMVATAAAFKGFVSGGVGGGGYSAQAYGSGNAGYSNRNYFDERGARQSIDLTGSFEVEGDKLVYVFNKTVGINALTRVNG